MKVKFSKPFITGKEIEYIKDILDHRRDSSGDGKYTKKVHNLLQKKYGVPKVLLTTSCTAALEFAVRLSDLKPGDEVIVPSFTFSSTVNAILLTQGIKVVFAEIDQNTMNIDPADVARKITKRTRVIIVVHYAGVACDMGKIMALAHKHDLIVIEDAAQAIDAKYKDQYLGTIGDFGCLSFHDTKNIICGEGGAIFINKGSKKLIEKAEIIREKGTNRTKFFKGLVDKYTWVDVGSSYLPSDILAAYLYGQLEHSEEILKMRLDVYNFYKKELQEACIQGIIRLPEIPQFATHNAHIFYIVFKNTHSRDFVLDFCRKHDVGATFHYIPLHSAPYGRKLGYVKDDLPITEEAASCLLRLPLYAGMSVKERSYVIKIVKSAIKLLQDEKIRTQQHTRTKYHRTNYPFSYITGLKVVLSLVSGFLVNFLG